jgi:hypothetical protein
MVYADDLRSWLAVAGLLGRSLSGMPALWSAGACGRW